MGRRETILVGLATFSAAVIAVSCALNAGGIVYVDVDDAGPITDAPIQTLSDGAIIESDGQVIAPDGAVVSGKCGSDQVDLDAGFCIDSHEVTNAQYAAFLEATQGDAGNDFAPCVGVSPDPGNGYEILTALNHPVRGVTWCSARSYCEWAGKRLCGAIVDGGEYSQTDSVAFKDASASEWYFACSANGSLAYPYGNTYDGGACDTSDLHEGGVIPVGSDPGCVGGYPGISDMSGNTWEWDNACSDDTTTNAQCRLRGGSFNTGSGGNSRCDEDFSYGRQSQSGDFGIRCCSDEKK